MVKAYLYGITFQFFDGHEFTEMPTLVAIFNNYKLAKHYVISCNNFSGGYSGLLAGYDDYDIITEEIPHNPTHS